MSYGYDTDDIGDTAYISKHAAPPKERNWPKIPTKVWASTAIAALLVGAVGFGAIAVAGDDDPRRSLSALPSRSTSPSPTSTPSPSSQPLAGPTVVTTTVPGPVVVKSTTVTETVKVTETVTETVKATETVTETVTPSGSPSATSSASSTAALTIIKAYITGYSWFDNTPAGSADISHPQDGRPGHASGTGTYDDPITVAVGHSLASGTDVLDWPEGTRFWIPNLRRYFIVEDSCGDGPTPQNGPCHDLTEAEPGAQTWLDVWVGGQGGNKGGSEACMNAITKVSTVVVEPDRRFESQVVPGDIYAVSCTQQYGDVIA